MPFFTLFIDSVAIIDIQEGIDYYTKQTEVWVKGFAMM